MNDYRLRKGSRIKLVGAAGYEETVFAVTGLRGDLAECDGENGRLLIPLSGNLPFALLVLPETPVIPAEPVPAGEPKEVEAPAAEPEEAKAPEAATEETETAPEQTEVCNTEPVVTEEKQTEEPAEEKPQEPAEKPKKKLPVPIEFEEGHRYNGKIQFFNWIGRWGKIDHPGTERGLFFHASQVEDDSLRTLLFTLEPGSAMPEITVSYVIKWNLKKTALAACAIMPEEEVPASVEGKKGSGVICAYRDNGQGSIMIDSNENRRLLLDSNIADPYLYHYLKQIEADSVEGLNIAVDFADCGRIAKRIVWTNREQEIEISDEEKENWEKFGSRLGEEKPKDIPAYQPW